MSQHQGNIQMLYQLYSQKKNSWKPTYKQNIDPKKKILCI